MKIDLLYGLQFVDESAKIFSSTFNYLIPPPPILHHRLFFSYPIFMHDSVWLKFDVIVIEIVAFHDIPFALLSII